MRTLKEYGFPYSFSRTSKQDVFKFYSFYKKDRAGHLKRKLGFSKLFPELYQEFQKFIFWGDISSFKFYEKLYHFLLDDNFLQMGHCKYRGKRCKFHLHGTFGYRDYCCIKCSNLSEEHIQSQLDKWNKKSQQEIKNMIELGKQTKITKYGDPFFNNMQKTYETKHKNDTFGKSLIEKKLIKWFTDNNFIFKYQYNTPEYPFNCDFYLPNYDLRIEIQGYFSHGLHPFNVNDKKDIKKLNEWKSLSTTKSQYKSAIKTWTISDPLKRKTSKENNLNYLEIFSSDLDECVKIILDKIKKIKGDS